jgi:CarboxypepD_reg-like domain/TonB-dependent Receptor Plug Domain
MKRQIFTLFLLFSCCVSQIATAQITQTIRGRVTDATTNKPLVGASVQVEGSATKTVSDTEGTFRLEKIAVGRYTLQISFVGFETASVSELLLESGKELVLDIPLNSLAINVNEVTVTGQRVRELSPVNGISNERLSRYPATFNDPARLLTYLPGATSDNDQGNNISVRGGTPNMNQWYLEGAEIVNPNHLSNAGTPSDRATVNGGGVLIPGFNVMESTQVYKGNMSADMGGALTSVMDIRLRKGNNERRETQVSIGLVGLEAGTEGVFSRNSKASYLVHYRYSTIGLLAKLGVPLGDEEQHYQDLTVNLNFPTKTIGTFNLFGMYGASDNIFKHVPEKTKWETDKDSQNIDFTNKMGAFGLRHEVTIGDKGRLSTVVAYSALENQRTAAGFGLNDVVIRSTDYKNTPSKLFLKSVFNYMLNAKNSLKIGMTARKDDVTNIEIFKISAGTGTYQGNALSWWLQPSVEWQGKFGENWTTQAGVRLVQWNFLTNTKKNETNIEPMANAYYRFDNNAILKMGYSLQSQMAPPQLTILAGLNSHSATYYENITKSNNFNVSYNFKLSKNLLASVEAYYQNIFEASTLSLNALEIAYGSSLTTGRNMGIEIDLQQQLTKGFYWRANASFYDSKSGTVNTRFNGHYISNVLIGKEWALGSEKNKFLGVNAHIILRGGYLDVYTNKQLKDYFRTDLNVYWKKNHARFSSTVQLDLQNVTNQQNEGWRYFDYHKGSVQTKYQLPTIPNLAYKIDF